MKSTRQNKIIELIEKYDIETQDALIEKLRENGFGVTQATISRDIKELKLTKGMGASGCYRYMLPRNENGSVPKFNSALAESIKRVDTSANMIVLKTYPGLAQAVATGIDAIHMSEMLGCVAGDDTIFIVIRDDASAKEIGDKIKSMIRSI